MKRITVLIFAVVSLFFFASCGNKVISSLSGFVFIEDEPVSDALVILSNGLETVTDENGRYVFPGINPGFYTVTARATENSCFPFQIIQNVTVGSGGSGFKNLEMIPVPNEFKKWNITVVGLESNLTADTLFPAVSYKNDVSLNFLKRNENNGLSLECLTEDGWKTALSLKNKVFPQGIQNYLNISGLMNPSQTNILLILKKGHGWRSSPRYPENVFFEETFSTFELSKALKGTYFDALISVRPYSNLVETAYQMKDNCKYYVGFEGDFPDCFDNLSSLYEILPDENIQNIESFLEKVQQDFSDRFKPYEQEMLLEKKGIAFSIINSLWLEELASRFTSIVDSIELLLSDSDYNLPLKMDLSDTLVWQPLKFKFEDYIDLGDWVRKVRSIIDGTLSTEGYAVKSEEIGFTYDISNQLVNTLFQDCDYFLELLTLAIKDKFNCGYNSFYLKNGYKYDNKDFSNSSGIAFWYPVAVEGGLWNVFGKEFYDKLKFSERTNWTAFLKRLLSIDVLPSQVLLRKEHDGSIICNRELYNPNKALDTSGITLNLGFIEREYIDKVWLVVGDDVISKEKIISNGGVFEEDPNSFRIYYPVSLEDQGKTVKARVWLKGANTSEENYAYKVNRIPQGNGIAIFDSNGKTLLYAVPGSSCNITSSNYMRFEIRTDKSEFSADSTVKIKLISNDTSEEKTIELTKRSETAINDIWESSLIKGEDIAYLGEVYTVLEFSNQDGYVKSVNRCTSENWNISISE